VPDTKWIPVVTANQWLIITRDANIAVNRAEIAAVRDNAARMVTLSGRDAVGTWNQLEILMTQWRQIQSLLDQPGPFIYAATRTSIRKVDLT
jgi:3-methyladenine DNA glycosylase Tag